MDPTQPPTQEPVQTPPEVFIPQPKPNYLKTIIFSVLIIITLGLIAYLFFQNQKLRKQVLNPPVSPTIQSSSPTPKTTAAKRRVRERFAFLGSALLTSATGALAGMREEAIEVIAPFKFITSGKAIIIRSATKACAFICQAGVLFTLYSSKPFLCVFSILLYYTTTEYKSQG